jgi:hypothetical protein
MLVSELIQILSGLDQNATVAMPDGLGIQSVQWSQGYVYLSDLSEDEIYELNNNQLPEDTYFPDDYAMID